MMRIILLRFALIWSLIGLFILIVISLFSQPMLTSIILLQDYIGQEVVVSGTVKESQNTADASFFIVQDHTAKISVVAFDKVNIKEGAQIKIYGTVSAYKGKLELIANKIICLKC